MHITDPIADMLTRIRNANNAKHDSVDVPASNMKKSIAQILLDEGYIKSYQIVDDGTQGIIRITLKYNAGKEKVLSLIHILPEISITSTLSTCCPAVIRHRWMQQPVRQICLLHGCTN